MSEFRNQAILDVADVLEIDLIDYARITRERVLKLELALRDLGKIPAVDFYNGNALITASEIIAKVLAREEKPCS